MSEMISIISFHAGKYKPAFGPRCLLFDSVLLSMVRKESLDFHLNFVLLRCSRSRDRYVSIPVSKAPE
jgi:hypothetical protein